MYDFFIYNNPKRENITHHTMYIYTKKSESSKQLLGTLAE